MRVANWDKLLNEYIESKRDAKFEWGINDCYTFTSGAVETITGTNPCSDIVGSYTNAREALEQYSSLSNLDDILDEHFERFEGRIAPRGSILVKKIENEFKVFGAALGIVIDHRAAFITPQGLTLLIIDEDDKAWLV